MLPQASVHELRGLRYGRQSRVNCKRSRILGADNLVTFRIDSTLSTLLVDCITKTVNSRNGGPKRRAKASTRGKSVSRSSTRSTQLMTAKAERLTLTYVRSTPLTSGSLMTDRFTGRTASLIFLRFPMTLFVSRFEKQHLYGEYRR